jgi:hypothetical protein
MIKIGSFFTPHTTSVIKRNDLALRDYYTVPMCLCETVFVVVIRSTSGREDSLYNEKKMEDARVLEIITNHLSAPNIY